jgi:hypothetical protein
MTAPISPEELAENGIVLIDLSYTPDPTYTFEERQKNLAKTLAKHQKAYNELSRSN